ncbi:ParB/RepB/Spo0J family partition protein [Methylotenera sp.]|uniref:ParB/RepB/Spo0J family partition protein n=1 Tax=Methylotenera sp. TaxID=2051956 RepID=UPI002ED77991
MSTMDKLKKRAIAQKVTADVEILIPLNKVKFDPNQPRQAFHALDGVVSDKDEAYISELAGSIEENGQIEAITVREDDDGSYFVVVGECRTRAHLKLGRDTIRAIVRNDLTNPSKRLLYQIAENVNRHDLTDNELWLAVQKLLKEGDDGEPMSQVDISRALGKKEDWVTKVVRFGDEDNQRTWVRTGIATSKDSVYLISLLPMPVQLEILRRVDLPEDDPERIEKPITRKVIDQLRAEVKQAKARAKLASDESHAQNEVAASVKAQSTSDQTQVVNHQDPIAVAMQESLEEAQAGSEHPIDSSEDNSADTASGGYALSGEVRDSLLTTKYSVPDTQVAVAADLTRPPSHCRVTLQNMENLIDLLTDDSNLLELVRGLECEVIIPNQVALRIANVLTGSSVVDGEVARVVQTALVKLS